MRTQPEDQGAYRLMTIEANEDEPAEPARIQITQAREKHPSPSRSLPDWGSPEVSWGSVDGASVEEVEAMIAGLQKALCICRWWEEHLYDDPPKALPQALPEAPAEAARRWWRHLTTHPLRQALRLR